MEWSKSNISKAELEKKQREFMEQALRMAQKSASTVSEELIPPKATAEVLKEEEQVLVTEEKEEIVEDNMEKSLTEMTEEVSDAIQTDFFKEPVLAVTEEEAVPAEENYGVFDAEELTGAIERGEITGDGLRQAAEILAEMTNKTEMMKKLLEEQEEKTAENGGDYGLNSFIDRHNNSCRGCEDGNGTP